MKVPLLDLQAQYESIRTPLLAAVKRVMESQRFILGAEVQEFEEEIGAYLKNRHAIGCASGSDALLLALMALDIKAGDEVITSPFTFFATGSAITRLGARPVFVDINPRTYNLDHEKIESAITSRTRAIMPVHLYGQCAEMEPLLELGTKHHLAVVEDAAQAIGAEYNGRRAGSLGLIGCFSFYPSKNLGGAGDGGLITTNDDDLADRLRRLRVHGGETEYEHTEVGINSRLDALQAAVLRVKLDYLEDWTRKRQDRAHRYTELLSAADFPFEVVTPEVSGDRSSAPSRDAIPPGARSERSSESSREAIPPGPRSERSSESSRMGCRHIFHQYVLRVPEHRDALMAHLGRAEIDTKIYYPIPLHRQKCFAYLGYSEGDLPETERASRETFALPLYPELTDVQQQYVANALTDFRP